MFEVSKDGERAYTLILNVQESGRFVKSFLEGLFDSSPYDVELSEVYGKIRVKVLS